MSLACAQEVQHRKQRTRSQKLLTVNTDSNEVYSIPMTPDAIAERSISREAKRAMMANRMQAYEEQQQALEDELALVCHTRSNVPSPSPCV